MYQARKFSSLPDIAMVRDLMGQLADATLALGPRRVDRPLVLYGAGNLGRMAKTYLDRVGIAVEFVVDANAVHVRQAPFWSGTKIFSPEEIGPEMQRDTLLAVCVVTAPYVDIALMLARAGWGDVVPFYDIAEAYRDRHPLSNGWFADPLSSDDVGRISYVLGRWGDDVSRAHHLQFIAWRRIREEWLFDGAPVVGETRFFIPEILSRLGDKESFADLGAHAGSVTLRFIEETEGKFEKIWAVEPDLENLQSLSSIVGNLPHEISSRIEVVAATLGSTTGKRNFYSGLGYASQISGLGKDINDIKTLDSFEISPSFVKLHLEGAELDALKGAGRTLIRSRPIVVATIYHNHLGIWECPYWLMENLPGYEHHFRLHSWCGTGAVIYSIPNPIT